MLFWIRLPKLLLNLLKNNRTKNIWPDSMFKLEKFQPK
jgi:hypothetical protein